MPGSDTRQEFAARLNWACDRAAIPPKNQGRQVVLGKMFGVTSKAARKWLEGEGMPRINTITDIADRLQVNAEWLLSGKGEREPSGGIAEQAARYDYDATGNVAPAAPAGGRVPLISWSDAVRFTEAVYIKQPTDGMAMVEVAQQVGPRSYALRVEGDSMEPEFPDGVLIVVDPDSTAKNKSFVLVTLPGQQEATFKQLVIDAGIQYLKPLNPAYRTQEMPKGATIIGVVKESRAIKQYE